MSLSDEQWEFLKDLAKLIAFAEGQNIKLTGGELWRTKEQQEIYLKAGKSKTQNSRHLIKMAIDLNLIVGNALSKSKYDYSVLGLFWEGLSRYNKWGCGGTKGDPLWDFNHFERTPL